jgi:DUF4097 and DUF4098 domain-containing protein YvlB
VKSHRLYSSFLIALAFVFVLLTAARGAEGTAKFTFSDPAKPGIVKILFAHGDLRIQGADTAEATVKFESDAATSAPRKDGLRVLTSSSSVEVSQKDNVVTLDATAREWSGDLDLTVPRNTSIVVQNSLGGDIRCTGIRGDVEIHSMDGEIRLDEVAGGVVVDTMNGEIRANIRELRESKPLSLTSMNGEIVLRVPADAKANVRFRTQNGAVLTDFPETALVTKTENAPGMPRRGRSLLPPEAQHAIEEAARVSAQAVQEAKRAIQEGVEAAREARRAHERAAANGQQTATPAVPPVPPVPPMPAIPTITGGKLVTGTLNGGGPEISVSTMNGDVTLRQLEKK